MAIYHFSGQVISRSGGKSATAAAAYRSGSEIVDEITGLTFDYSHKQGVDFSAVFAPDFAPPWATDRAQLWNKAEKAEKRKDAQVAREFNIALPVELSHQQKIDLMNGFVKTEFVARGMIADVNGHQFDSANPHFHAQLTMRELAADGEFSKTKNRDWNDKALLEHWREAWAEHANRALEAAGHDVRIDHRTLEAQGVDREAGVHMGPAASAMERKGIRTELGDLNREIQERNEVREQLRTIDEAIAAQKLATGDVRGAAQSEFAEKIVVPGSPGPVVLNTNRPAYPPLTYRSSQEITAAEEAAQRAYDARIQDAKRKRDSDSEKQEKRVRQEGAKERKPLESVISRGREWDAYEGQVWYVRLFRIGRPTTPKPDKKTLEAAQDAWDTSKGNEETNVLVAKDGANRAYNDAERDAKRMLEDTKRTLEQARKDLQARLNDPHSPESQQRLERLQARFEQQAQREAQNASKAPPSPSSGPRL